MYTKSDLIGFEHRWSIDSFSSSFFPFNTLFSSPADKNIIFRVFMFVAENATVSLMLDLATDEKNESINVSVDWKVSVLDKEGQKSNTKECTIMLCDGVKSLPPSISFDNIIESLSDFVTEDDKLCFHFEINYTTNTVKLDENEHSQKVARLCRQAEKQALDGWLSLLQKQIYCDVVICLGQGENIRELKAHRAVLASHSEVFAAMFATEMQEKLLSRVHITEHTKSGLFEQFLAFLYSGKIESVESYAGDLLILADKYCVQSLRAFCEQYLANTLSLQSCISVMIHADMHNAIQLKSDAIEYIVRNICEVIETTEWNELITAMPALFNQIFRQVVSKRN